MFFCESVFFYKAEKGACISENESLKNLMADSQKNFLELVTDCFGDDLERTHGARDLLRNQLSEQEGAFEEVNTRLEKSTGRSRWYFPVLYTIVILLGLLIAGHSGYQLYQMRGVVADTGALNIPSVSTEEDHWEFYLGELSEKDKLLLFGDTKQNDRVEQVKGLWLSEPDNPGAYIEYLLLYESWWGDYPADMFQVAEEIDSENAIYALLQAAALAEDCTKKIFPTRRLTSGKKGSKKKSKRRKAAATKSSSKVYVSITDEEKFREAIKLLRRAAEMPSCSKYGHEMMQRRILLLKRDGHDWVTRVLPFTYLAFNSSSIYQIIKLSQLIDAEAYRCEQEKDTEGLKQIVRDWRALYRHLHSASESLIDALILRAFLHSPCSDFASAAKACELDEMELYFTTLDQKFNDQHGERRRVRDAMTLEDDIELKGGVLSGMSLPAITNQLNDASAVSVPDIVPDRLADHAFWNRLMSVLHWALLLIIAAITVIYKYCSNQLAKRIAGRMVGIFGIRDWLYVLCLGTLLPVAVYWIVNGARTPLSVQNWYLGYKDMALPAGQSASLLLLLLFAPMLAISHRLQRLIPFKERERMLIIWIAAGLALFSMPVFGLALVIDFDDRVVIKLGYAMQAVSLLLLLLAPIFDFVNRQRKGVFGVMHHIRHHILVTVLIISSFVMALHVPIYHSIEKHWVAEDEIFKISSEHTSLTQHESLVTKLLLQELEEEIQQLESE